MEASEKEKKKEELVLPRESSLNQWSVSAMAVFSLQCASPNLVVLPTHALLVPSANDRSTAISPKSFIYYISSCNTARRAR